jgi:uncharacterized protein
MNRYQLAKILDWAGTLETRKRMQKVVYLLQVAGCPLGADYTLHHYGPYSQEVARLADEMVQAGLFTESASANAVGQQFSYRLSESARDSLADFERSPAGQAEAARLDSYLSDKRWLLMQDLRDLEYAATIVFFREQGHDWPLAIERMCRFKGLTSGDQVVERATKLAQRVIVM